MRKGKTLVADLPRIVILVDKDVKQRFRKKCLILDTTQQAVGLKFIKDFIKP